MEVEDDFINCEMGDRVMLSNGMEDIWVIVAYTNNKNNSLKGIILSKLRYSKQYNYNDVIGFGRKNILTKLEDQRDASIHEFHRA